MIAIACAPREWLNGREMNWLFQEAWVAGLAGIAFIILGLYGLFVRRLTSDDGSLLIAGSVLLGTGLIAAGCSAKKGP